MKLIFPFIAILAELGSARAEPPYDDCPRGFYLAASGNCVERPDRNPYGATALCGDGLFSHSEHPGDYRTCSWRYGNWYIPQMHRHMP
jgi:nucleoside-diphosphate-sugar epimerase